ncbi:MAG: DegT/DnrJ/EryC1/StrS family aminotransferase [Gaiellaceae bacterium]
MTTSSATGAPVALNDLRRSAALQHDELVAALSRVTASGRYIQGPETAAFELELASYLGVSHCVGVGNGTDALELALLGVGSSPGDDAVMAANAGMYAATAARRIGLRPRFADVDPVTLCLSRPTVGAALTPATRVVVVTHLYGRVAAVEEIVELCRAREIAVVEDCAQAAGARLDAGAAGSFGDAAAFSFYPTKNLGAAGDGGAVVTSRDDVAQAVRSVAQYGWAEKYRVVRPNGRNSRLDELQAAILRLRLPHLDDWNARRRVIVTRYMEALPPSAGRFVAADEPSYVGHLAVFLAPDRPRAERLLAGAGIGTAVHYPIADHRQPVFGGEYDGLTLPVTEAGIDRVLTVPCFPELTEPEIERVCEALVDL